jgi:hypothetical protein
MASSVVRIVRHGWFVASFVLVSLLLAQFQKGPPMDSSCGCPPEDPRFAGRIAETCRKEPLLVK